jgi:large subunit ribosomal protein L1
MANTKSKRYRKMVEGLDRSKKYNLKEAISVVKQKASAKFDETVEMAFRLGVDAKKSDQMVRGVVSLPHGTGKTVRVLALVSGSEKEKEAKDAGADYAGGDDLIEKIAGGWTDFDIAIATPDVMKKMAKLGKVLGPKGLMPSPKAGTVTQDIGQAVKEVKKGKIEFKMDKTGIVHVSIGKVSFNAESLYDNAMAVSDAVNKARPKTAKGIYVLTATLTSTMGPGLPLDQDSLNLTVQA